MTQEKKLVLAIPSYHRPKELGWVLEDLADQTNVDFRVVVLNDGANPKTKELLNDAVSRQGFELFVLETPKPSGLPKARNVILDFVFKNLYSHKKQLYLVFLDDDVRLKKDFVQKIFNLLDQGYEYFCFRIKPKHTPGIVDIFNRRFLQFLFKPLIGRCWLNVGFIFGGFYLPLKGPKQVQHLPGVFVYPFFKHPKLRFDTYLNPGSAILEDTEFALALKKDDPKAKFYYFGNYSIIHLASPKKGCRVEVEKRFFYYWRNKFYLAKKYGANLALCKVFSGLECFLLSLLNKINLFPIYRKCLRYPS